MDRLGAAASLDQQRRVAGALAARGVSVGERVALVAAPSTALVSAVLGALRTGIVAVPLDPTLHPHERQALVELVEPALVVDDLAPLLAGRPTDLAPAPLARPLHFTSGTTAEPKGVWSGLLDEAAAAALLAEEVELWGLHAGDTHLVCSPLHHSAPLRFAAATLLAGGEVVVPGPFDPARFAAVAARHRPTTAFLTPAHLQRLLAPGAPPPDLASFRLVAHAAAPCPEPLKRRALAAFPPGALWEFYGSTEGQFTACPPGDWLERPGTVGRARPGRRLATDGDGTVWCTPPAHARFEYWRDPARTASAWRDGAFTVGDVGRLDGDGFLFLEGRRDDLIISGGVNVSPVEVEAALAAHPAVHDVAVFAAPDDRWGSRVCAAVVGPVDPDDLLAFARARLAPAKRPKQVVSVAEIPRTAAGKTRRRHLALRLGLG